MKRCVLLIPDASPLNSLWVIDRLDLLLHLDMPIVMVDAVYAELTSDLDFQKDRDMKAFVETHSPPFIIEETLLWADEQRRRKEGGKRLDNIGELAMMEFANDTNRIQKYTNFDNDPLLILFEDRSLIVVGNRPNIHLLSTVAFLRGMERQGFVHSASDLIEEMQRPTKLGRSTEGQKEGSH